MNSLRQIFSGGFASGVLDSKASVMMKKRNRRQG